MNEIASQIIEELYFITSFQDLKNSLEWNKSFEKELYSLVKKGWVYQYHYANVDGDFIRNHQPDVNHIADYHYLASKKGLLIHSGL